MTKLVLIHSPLVGSFSWSLVAAELRQSGWPIIGLEAGHFHMLVDETAVTNHILNLLTQLTTF